jgi:hypothetical protein
MQTGEGSERGNEDLKMCENGDGALGDGVLDKKAATNEILLENFLRLSVSVKSIQVKDVESYIHYRCPCGICGSSLRV